MPKEKKEKKEKKDKKVKKGKNVSDDDDVYLGNDSYGDYTGVCHPALMGHGYEVSAAYAMPGYGYQYGYAMAGYGYPSAYDTSTMAAMGMTGAAMGTTSAAAIGEPSDSSKASSRGGKMSESKSLLEELKAKQAARASMKEEQKKLQEHLEVCDETSNNPQMLMQSAALRFRLQAVQHNLWLMGESTPDASLCGANATSSSSSSFQPPEDGSVDQFGRLCHLLAGFLKTCDRHTCMLSRAVLCEKTQMEWNSLIKSGIVSKTANIAEVLVDRPNMFKIIDDASGRRTITLLGAPGAAGGDSVAMRAAASAISSALSSAADRQRDSRSDGSLLSTSVIAGASSAERFATVEGNGNLRPEQVAAIESHLKKCGGLDRLSNVGSIFGVRRAQVRSFFLLEENHRGDTIVSIPDSPQQKGNLSDSQHVASNQLKSLDEQIKSLRTTPPTRSCIAECMCFCIENASHAAALARRLIQSLEEYDLKTRAVIARLYVVSDVLYNSSSEVKGASKYRASFQELLPDACEKLGRQWLRRIESKRHQAHAEDTVHKVLGAWQEWGVFTQLFVRGLEALLFAPVMEASDPENENDKVLQSKLSRWYSPMNAARLPYAARVRGLSGSALPTAACRNRLCHYERYWHRPGVEEAVEQVDDPWGEELRQQQSEPHVELQMQQPKSPVLNSADNEAPVILDEDIDGVPLVCGEDGLDGDELSEGDYEEEEEISTPTSKRRRTLGHPWPFV